MPFTDAPLQDEIAAVAAWVADRALGALSGAEGIDVLAVEPPGAADPRTVLAAVRVLGPDVFAPGLFTGAPCGPATVHLVAEACRLFRTTDLVATAGDGSPSPAAGRPQWPGTPAAASPPPGELVVGWLDSATAELLAGLGEAVPVARPTVVPEPAPLGRPRWSVQLAQLSCLALPGLEGPVHALVRREPLALARGATRSLLRRDHRTATRLVRWLAWLAADGGSVPLDLPPVLRHLRLVGGGGPRTTLDLEIAALLLPGEAPR